MRVAVHQSRTGIDPAANAAAIVEAVRLAKDGGADMLFTPEMSGLLDRDRARAASSLREEDHDPTLAAVIAAARDHGIWVSVGSLAVRDGTQGKLLNRSFVIDPEGRIRARYDKIHLFDVDLPTGESWRESSAYRSGTSAVAVDLPWGRLGLSICYDLRFPDLYRALSDGGATMLAVPAAFTASTGKAHWEVLLRARAIEAGAFVIAAAQHGLHDDGRVTYGHSLVIDPWGAVLLDMEEALGVGFADIDLSQIDDVRARIPALAHRRPIDRVEIAS